MFNVFCIANVVSLNSVIDVLPVNDFKMCFIVYIYMQSVTLLVHWTKKCILTTYYVIAF